MKTNAARRNRRTLAQGLAATFGRIEPPQAGRLSLLALATASLLVTGVASADWRVYDSRLERALEDIRDDRIGRKGGTVTEHLDDLNGRLAVRGGTYDPEADGEAGDEEDGGNGSRLAEAPDFEQEDRLLSRRCGGEKLPAEQRAVCEAIVRLEAARYGYLQAMRRISEKREDELKRIARERDDIGEGELGRLESNTNRLLALLTHQRIDALNLQMALATYDARIRERQEQLNYLGAAAMNPRNRADGAAGGGLPGGGALFDGAAQRAALQAALEIARTRDR